MQPNNQNDFDFIMGPNKPAQRGPSFLQNGKNKIIMSILFVSIVLIVVIGFFSVITSLGKQNNDDVIDVVAWQTELARIAELGIDEAKNPDTRSQVSTLYAFLQTDIASTSSYLSNSGVKLNSQQLGARQDSTVVKDLESATQLNRYDEELLEILDDKTARYKAALQTAIQASEQQSREAVLNTAATNIITYEGTVATTE